MKVLVKMGLRNVTRRKLNTVIVVLGLMIGTTIISSALVIGDTLENMFTKEVYDEYHETDELVYTFDQSGSLGFFNYSRYEGLNAFLGAHDTLSGKVEDVSPEINYQVSVFDHETKLSENEATLIGFDHDESVEFGKLYPVDGSPGSLGSSVTGEELDPGEVYVNEALAEEIDAEEGHSLEIFYGENLSSFLTIKAVVETEGRAAYEDSMSSTGNNIFMPLGAVQALLDQPDRLNVMKVSNTGDERDGVEHSDTVEEGLEPYLRSGMPILLLSKAKQDSVERAEASSDGMQDIFIMLGSFSIIAGMMLIVNIFVMLAEERRQEMGMARAVGMSRKHLMSMFLFEGTAYAVMSAAVGTLVGVLVAFLVIAGIGAIDAGEQGPLSGTSGSLEFFTVTVDSLVLAFSAGMLITLLTIWYSSRKASRLNIIRAIRRIPEPRYKRHEMSQGAGGEKGAGISLEHFRTMVYDIIMRQYELLIMAFCALLVFLSLVDVGPFYLSQVAGYGGLSGFIYGLGLLLRRYITDERAFTLAGGVVLVLWCYPYDLFDQLFGITLEGDMEMMILAGLFMVSSALMIIMYNSNFILAGLMRLFGRFRSLAPVFKTAISYPMDNRFRTGMTLAMFALIIFTVTLLSMMVSLFSGNIEQMTEEQSGGYDMIAQTDPEYSLTQLDAQIRESENLSSSDFSAVVPLDTAYVMMYPVRQSGGSPEEQQQLIDRNLGMDFPEFMEQEDSAWYDLVGCTDQFFRESDFELEGWDEDRYDDHEDVWKAVKENPGLVVLDTSRMLEEGEGEDGGGHGPFRRGGIFRVMAGDRLIIRDIQGTVRVVEVVGFTKSRLINGIFIGSEVVTGAGEGEFASEAASLALIRFDDDVSESEQKDISKRMEQEFLASGMKTFIVREELEGMLGTMTSFMTLMRAFLSLGLVVGIAGLGIITIRSVAERRQQIGMLRAIGFKRGMIMKSFLIESSYIALLGILTGVGLGIILSLRFYLNDSTGPGFSGAFIIPWNTLILISLLSYALTFLATVGPSRGAARTVSAEALRYMG